MKGKLTDQPLVELVREISAKGLSGTLRIARDRAQIAVYFEAGRLIFAAANLRTLRLREYLSKLELLTETELASLETNLSDPALAAQLSASGRLAQQDINSLLDRLVSDVLRVALLMTEGTWEFSERSRLGDPVQVTLDVASLLLEAARRLPAKYVADRLRNPSETISRTTEAAGARNLLASEGNLLSRLHHPTKLADLVALSGLSEPDAYRVIYGLALGGLVKREYWQNAFRTQPQKPGEQSQPLPAATPSAADSAIANGATSPGNEEAALKKFLERVGSATNHYEVIALPPTSPANEIKDAYYALARSYHPDRFHLRSGTPLHSELSSAFARITQAYEILTDANARAAYDQALERSRLFAGSAPKSATAEAPAKPARVDTETAVPEPEKSAENNFKEGFDALQQGRISAALAHLAAAAGAAPQEARYRAYYGRALAANEQTRRLAENELQAAIKLEPAQAVFRTMLGELYFELKFHRRARTEVERALALEPNNAPAQALLRKLENSRKVV